MYCKTKNISTPYTTNIPKLVTTPVSRFQYKTGAAETILYTTRLHKAFQTSGSFVRETSTVSRNLNFLSTLSKSVLTSTSRTTKTTQVSKKSSKLQPENPPVSNVQSTIVYRSKTSSVTTKAHTTLPTTTRTELLQTTTFIHTSTILSGASTTSKNVSQQPLSVEPCSGVNSTTKPSKQYNDIIRTEDFFVIFYIQIGIVALVTFVAFVLVCLLTYIIILLRKGRETKQSSQYELSARTTPEPRMYSQLLMPSQRIYSSTRSNSVDNPLF